MSNRETFFKKKCRNCQIWYFEKSHQKCNKVENLIFPLQKTISIKRQRILQNTLMFPFYRVYGLQNGNVFF